MFATGGSTPSDSVIRLYDLKNLSLETIANDNICATPHGDVVHSIKCNAIITSINWRKTIGGCYEMMTTHGNPENEIKLW
jgi:hypothetical protein